MAGYYHLRIVGRFSNLPQPPGIPLKILEADPRRRWLVLRPETADAYLAQDETGQVAEKLFRISSAFGGPFNLGVPPITHNGPVFVMADAGAILNVLELVED